MLLRSVILGLSALALGSGCSSPQRLYAPGEVEVLEIQALDDDVARIVYSTPEESLWYCPGVRIYEADKEIDLEFVRSPIDEPPTGELEDEHFVSQMPPASGPAAIVVHHKGKLVHVRAGGRRSSVEIR